MFSRKTSRNFFSALVLGVYLFAALFSQNFHHHQATVYKISNESSLEKDFSKSDIAAETSGCLWCHFLYTGNSDLPEEFSFKVQSFENFSAETLSLEFHSFSQLFELVSLRGPPLNIV